MMHLGYYTPPIGFATSEAIPPPALESERLMKRSETSGQFWLADAPDKACWGSAIFKPSQGIRLVLDGDLIQEGTPIAGRQVPLIHGRLFNGAICTVFNCSCMVEVFVADREYPRTHVASQLLVVGGHWRSVDACQFTEVQFRLSHLDQWFDNPYTIHHKRSLAKSLISFEPDQLDANFIFQNVKVSMSTFCARSIPITAEPEGSSWPFRYRLTLHPETSQPVLFYIQLVSALRETFSFLIGCGTFTLDVVGLQSREGSESPQVFEINHPVVVPRAIRTDAEYFSTRHSGMKSSTPNLIAAWFENREKLRIVQIAYAELLCSDGLTPETIFLRTVQTLEHFYGVLWPDETRYVKKETLGKLLEWVEANFPRKLEGVSLRENERLEGNRGALIGQFKNVNGLTFQSRMEKFFLEVPASSLMPLVGNPRDIHDFAQSFVKKITATRHYLTHFSADQMKNAFPEQEMESAAITCWAVLTYWIGEALGVDTKHASEMALRAKKAMFLVRSRTLL